LDDVIMVLCAGYVAAVGEMALAPLLHTFYINDFSKQLPFLVFDTVLGGMASRGWLCAAW
jgi:hypothetical protein